jgi:voltage-gated potassium channel
MARRDLLVTAGRRIRQVPRPNIVERRMSKFLREPPSVRNAVGVIVTVTFLIVLGGGALMRVIDHREFPSIGLGLWWAVQTVTTVGYGDVTPKDISGRLVAAFVMLEGIAAVAVFSAGVTSVFVTRAEREREKERRREPLDPQLQARFDELNTRLDSLEAALNRLADSGG